MVIWKVAEAKHSLSRLLEDAQRAPQLIHRRHELVGAVLGADEARAYLEWRRQREVPTLAELVRKIGEVCAEEDYELPVEPRRDRHNPLAEPRSPRGRKATQESAERRPRRRGRAT